MRIAKIPKGKTGFRTIYVPDSEEKKALRFMLPELNALSKKKCGDCAHGFIPGRNNVTNAMQHIGWEHTLSFDLEDFFDNVSKKHLDGVVSAGVVEQCLVDGAPRQGLPTSPPLSNLAAIKMDKAIKKALAKNVGEFVYTRYADDITISFNDFFYAEKIKNIVKNTVTRCGFSLNEQKTKLQWSRNGRRIITGIAVDDKQVYPPRWLLRKLRAAKHQKNHDSAQGLAESAKCKVPKKNGDTSLSWVTDALSSMGLTKINEEFVSSMPEKHTVWIDRDTIVTGDPIYIAGMSRITTGWTSCMAPGKTRFRGVKFYLLLEGARIACTLSNKTVVINGREYRKMINRALLFNLRDGSMAYSKIYGNSKNKLKKKLENFGAVCASRKKGVKVVGRVPRKTPQPYLDNGVVVKANWRGQPVMFIRL